MPPKLLCDENIPAAVKASLKEWGFRLLESVPGTGDSEVARQAKVKRAVLITFDADFASIIAYPPQEYFGIVRINIHPQFPRPSQRRSNSYFRSYKRRRISSAS